MHSIILSFPVIVLTAYAAWTDYKRKEIDNWIPAVILTYGIILNAFLNPARFTESIMYMLTVFAVLFTIYIITNGKLGGGDVKLLTALAFFFGNNIIFLLFVAGMIVTVYGTLKGIKNKTYLKTETIFGPSIFIATVLTSILLF
ncbi:peptidase A24 [Thermoanaerobacter sp. YS13]|uniref:prepilin peptidase n=1 Tax=Thermoanaerobacter sp. YS13 TaxID=1511746 RepID=UPI0005731DBA|nr:A24 family peptidase [Thermoanaerobacter sp. YS13]KHO63215.1 peptidase A24 [Thermoanaerobacter sp. YS13]